MFESFRNFVAEFVEGDKHPKPNLPTTTIASRRRLCWCTPPASTATCRRASATSCMRSSCCCFDLDDKLTDELIDRATAAEHEAVDLYHFTKLLSRVHQQGG